MNWATPCRPSCAIRSNCSTPWRARWRRWPAAARAIHQHHRARGVPGDSRPIANTWAQAYVQQVNRVYGQVSDEMVNTVTAELQTAQQTYAAAQQQLELTRRQPA